MTVKNGRIKREKETIEKMIKIYCNDKHGTKDELCPECKKLLDYAYQRLDNCKFGESKPVCKDCSIHCYGKDMRVKIKEVMKFSGPRMLYKYPLFSLKHYLDKFK